MFCLENCWFLQENGSSEHYYHTPLMKKVDFRKAQRMIPQKTLSSNISSDAVKYSYWLVTDYVRQRNDSIAYLYTQEMSSRRKRIIK